MTMFLLSLVMELWGTAPATGPGAGVLPGLGWPVTTAAGGRGLSTACWIC